MLINSSAPTGAYASSRPVFTLPGRIADIAYQNKAVIYDLLFKASAETMLAIAADPKHLGARIGFTSVLHTWGSSMTHHPHVHMIVPGGGLSINGSRWVAAKPSFLHARSAVPLLRWPHAHHRGVQPRPDTQTSPSARSRSTSIRHDHAPRSPER
jgi:hypothetical protein